MARYWMYLDGQVEGPFGVEQLIRKKGFSRQTLVCVEDPSGKPQNWISPADIPELAHIFKAIDDKAAEPAPMPKAPVKRSAPAPRVYTPAVMLRPRSSFNATFAGWMLLAALLAAGGAFAWHMQSSRTAEKKAQQDVRRLIENLHLSSGGPQGTLAQYLAEKDITPRWEFEKKIDGLYNVTLSWYAKGAATGQTQTIYAFEVNTQAQTVRALNSAAVKLLSGAITSAQPAKPAEKVEAPKKAKAPSFDTSIGNHVTALGAGDFQAVWSSFSKRKRAEMARGGISRDGYIRLQALTHRLESGAKYEVVKSIEESPTEKLVLVKQSQPGRADVFIKQLWVNENDEWKLDDEQKRSSQAPETPKPTPTSLPGMSN